MNNVILKIITKITIPLIVIFALYIQIHGEQSPGGGFQAGAILASGFILFGLVFSNEILLSKLSNSFLQSLAALGCLIYLAVGVASLFFNGRFLEYSVLMSNSQNGQKLGITLIEFGVGITVFAVFMLIYSCFVSEMLERD